MSDLESEEDTLEGYRAQDVEEFSEVEAALMRALNENRGLLELINVGLDMKRFLSTPAGKRVWQRAEEKLGDSIRDWLSSADPTTPAVCAAHFNARVAIQVLQEFKDAIDSGREAAQQLAQKESDNEQSIQ